MFELRLRFVKDCVTMVQGYQSFTSKKRGEAWNDKREIFIQLKINSKQHNVQFLDQISIRFMLPSQDVYYGYACAHN